MNSGAQIAEEKKVEEEKVEIKEKEEKEEVKVVKVEDNKSDSGSDMAFDDIFGWWKLKEENSSPMIKSWIRANL